MHEFVRDDVQRCDRSPDASFAERHIAPALRPKRWRHEMGVVKEHGKIIDNAKHASVLVVDAHLVVALEEVIVGPSCVHVGVDESRIRPGIV